MHEGDVKRNSGKGTQKKERKKEETEKQREEK